MVAQNPGLTMKFREKKDDVVSFDATAEDKQDLLRLIDASSEDLEHNRVEVLLHTGADEDVLKRMRDIISETAGNDNQIEMPQTYFATLSNMAATWKFHGFDMFAQEEEECFGVSRKTIDAVLDMQADACEM